MKLLINLCAHDGIISYYTGVGTMVQRYIKTLIMILEKRKIDYHINLYTPEYNQDSFGYNDKVKLNNTSLKHVSIIEVANGSNGTINYGPYENWLTLSKNTAFLINNIDFTVYDKVITIANDTPFACLQNYLVFPKNHQSIWIAHSTAKIHKVDSAVKNSAKSYDQRVNWESDAVKFINNNANSYFGAIGKFITSHMINEYNLLPLKIRDIYNGEILNEEDSMNFSLESAKLFEDIKNFKNIVFSFARAEEYKNLKATMYIGQKLNIPTVVIAQSYYKTQPILDEYRLLAKKCETQLYIDPPFDFAKYILHNFKGKIIMIVPSEKETMGLIINEIRKMNKKNILLVTNNIDGLNEQVKSGVDGLLIDANDYEGSSQIILKHFNEEDMNLLCTGGFKRLCKDYDFLKNMQDFLDKLMGE